MSVIRSRPKTNLGSIGDPMSELNIQRRLQWWRERSPSGIVRVSQDSVNKDPALQRALLELPWPRYSRPTCRSTPGRLVIISTV